MRHHDDAGAPADLAVQPRRVADRLARRFSQGRSHELGRGSRGEPPRDKQQHLSGTPCLTEVGRGDLSRLAGARPRTSSQCLHEVCKNGVDRRRHAFKIHSSERLAGLGVLMTTA